MFPHLWKIWKVALYNYLYFKHFKTSQNDVLNYLFQSNTKFTGTALIFMEKSTDNGDKWDTPLFFTIGLMLEPNLCVPRKGVSAT